MKILDRYLIDVNPGVIAIWVVDSCDLFTDICQALFTVKWSVAPFTNMD